MSWEYGLKDFLSEYMPSAVIPILREIQFLLPHSRDFDRSNGQLPYAASKKIVRNLPIQQSSTTKI